MWPRAPGQNAQSGDPLARSGGRVLSLATPWACTGALVPTNRGRAGETSPWKVAWEGEERMAWTGLLGGSPRAPSKPCFLRFTFISLGHRQTRDLL